MNYQTAYMDFGQSVLKIDLPGEDEYVLPNVRWGSVIAFPTVAYWYFSVVSSRLEDRKIAYKLGRTLKEEIGACLLGGYGIPASVGLAAYEKLRLEGIFDSDEVSEADILKLLSEPIMVGEKSIKYRFAKQKSKYLFNALAAVNSDEVPMSSGRALRDWLTDIKGIGLKTASWIARNFMDADDVAIIDIHLFRAGLLAGFFDVNSSIDKDYLNLEEAFLKLANSMEVRASELDAVIWYEMQRSSSIKALMEQKFEGKLEFQYRGVQKSRANSEELATIC